MRESILVILITMLALSAKAEMRDTVRVSKSQILITSDSIYAPEKDTFYILTASDYRVRKNPYTTSQEFYKSIKEKTGNNIITAKLFDLLYNPRVEKRLKPIDETKKSNSPFEPYANLIIHSIKIKHVDILEGSVNDTLIKASSYIATKANQLHITTWNTVIRNNLRMKKGQQIKPLKLADTERLLRRLNFIEDARIYAKKIGTEEVALVVVIKDRFAWGLASDLSSYDKFNIELLNRNIGGLGKYASIAWLYSGRQHPPNGYVVNLGAQEKSAINWELDHSNDGDRESWGATFQKEFASPDIKWVGGLEIRDLRDSTINRDGETIKSMYYDMDFQDLWLGRSFKLPSKTHRKNLIISSRYLRNDFKDRPVVSPDSNRLYYNRQLILSEVSFAGQQYIKTNYVTGFGVTEDIPLGYRISLIAGKDFNEFSSPKYYGFQFFWSFYLKDLGYLLINQETGAFKSHKYNAGVFKNNINYFSPLMSMGRYYVRNFLTLNFTNGINQSLSRYIDMENYIRDINGKNVLGNSSFALSVESILYTPWYLYGFKFAPFFYYNAGELWDSRAERHSSYGYQGFGGGIRMRNVSLAINTLEMRFTYFPTNPEEKNIAISFTSTLPISFENFFKFKPIIIPYR